MSIKYSLIFILSIVSLKLLSCAESAGADVTICENNLPLNLGVSSDTSWSGDGVDVNGLFNPTGSGVYTLTLHTNSSSCTDSDEKVITVLASPTVNAGDDQLICVFTDFQINATASSPNGNIVVWSWSGDDQFLNSTNISNPVATPTGSSSFNLTVADVAGCANFDQINLTTAPLPIVDAGADLEMCQVADLQALVGTPAGGNWSGPGVTGNNFSSPAIGTHNLEYAYTDANGCFNSDIKTINVSPHQVLDPGSIFEVCEDANEFTLSGYSPIVGVTWSGVGVVNANIGTLDPGSLNAGINEVTMTFGQNTCQVSEIKEIFVNTIPSVSVNPDYHFCQNELDSELINESPLGGTWSGMPVSNENLGTVNTGVNPGNYSVTYSYTDPATACSNFINTELIIHEIPVANFTAESIACIDVPLSITNNSSTDLEYTWTVNGAPSSAEEQPEILLSAEGDYIINLEVISAFGCFDEGEALSVEVISAPSALFSLDVIEGCEPLEVQTVNESQGDYLSYDWDFSISTSTEEDPVLVNFGDISEDTNYEINLTIENNCGVSQHTETVSAIAKPEANFQATLDLQCSPALVHFENNSSANSDSYSWNLGDGDVSNTETPDDKIYLADLTPENYTITLEAINDCGVSQISQDIIVLPNVVEAGFFTSDIEACAPVTIDFNDSSINTTDITYDFSGETVDVSDTQRTYSEEGIFEVFQYVTDGCGFDTTSVIVTIFPEPIVSYNLGDDVLCKGDYQLFEFTGELLSSSEWLVDGASVSSFTGVSQLFDNEGIFEVEFNGVTALNGCSISDMSSLEVYSAPSIDLGAEYFSGCEPFSLSLENLEASSGNIMNWEIGSYASDNQSPTFNFSESGLFDLFVSAENAFGCVSELNLNDAVEIFPTPTAEFTFASEDYDILYNSEVQFENTSEGGSLFYWQFGDGEESFEQNPSHEYLEAGIFPVTLITSNSHNCSDVMSTAVKIDEDFSLFMPNSFTPNGDGFNEVFKPEIEGVDYLEYTFRVYDRWGSVIFMSHDVELGWTGNIKNGDHYASPGVYSWEITFKLPLGQVSPQYTGTVSLIR